MKKALSVLIILVLITACVPALAYKKDGRICEGIPSDVDAYFSKDTFKDWTMTSVVSLADYCFVMMKNGKNNVLYGFKLSGQKYKYWMRTDSSVPQGAGIATVENFGGVINPDNNLMYNDNSIAIIYEDNRIQSVFSFLDNIWMLRHYHNMETGANICITANGLSYYNKDHQYTGRADGTYQRDLRYAAVNSIPQTLKQARQKLTTAPAIPGSDKLTAKDIKFTGGQSYSVYTGPGTDYLRGANGKAKVSTNDWIQVFGREDGYILIQYAISADHYRFGWIEEGALPKKATVAELDFNVTAALTTRNCSVTDDPLYSRTELAKLSAGTEVTWLATMGTWAYIEVYAAQPVRGFVPAGELQVVETVLPADSTGDNSNG